MDFLKKEDQEIGIPDQPSRPGHANPRAEDETREWDQPESKHSSRGHSQKSGHKSHSKSHR